MPPIDWVEFENRLEQMSNLIPNSEIKIHLEDHTVEEVFTQLINPEWIEDDTLRLKAQGLVFALTDLKIYLNEIGLYDLSLDDFMVEDIPT